jgi:phosphogluconate dehydratase
MPLNARVQEVTDRIAARSRDSRALYLERIAAAVTQQPERYGRGCANQAHNFAAASPFDKLILRSGDAGNVAILTAYNDVLSAHQPYERFPELIREAARAAGGVAQVAGGVPAMCDGITQGETGMELSLFSRDVIALSAAVALSHQTFDAMVCLGICDKIVPGMVIGALSFGHLPAVFLPGGPMPSGFSNDARKLLRQRFAEGLVSRDELLQAEADSYHAPGTCTFYGTANTNQMMMEIMGLHLPGSSFVNPNTPLRDALTKEGVRRALAMTAIGEDYTPIGELLDEKAFVNGLVGLLATGGSTNHTMHLPAMAAAAGIKLEWNDFEAVAEVTPLLVRVYPNGKADVNHFHAAGGMGFLIRELLGAGMLHSDVKTVWGTGLDGYTMEPFLDADFSLTWRAGTSSSGDDRILRPVSNPFETHGGLTVVHGNLGKAIAKTSALAADRHTIEGEIRIFHSQEEVQKAFKTGELHRDVIIVVRFQGPRANGMPELHKLLPPLQAIQNHGFKVALITDGRLSGASGDVLSAIHLTPEAEEGGPIAKLRDGDRIRFNVETGELTALVDVAEWVARPIVKGDYLHSQFGVGRELFRSFRATVSPADQGASIFFPLATHTEHTATPEAVETGQSADSAMR